MWKTIESSLYSMHFVDSQTIKIYVTDFITLWHAYFSANEFLSVLKGSNSLLSGSKDEIFITKGKEILKSPEKLMRLDITPEEDFISIYIIKLFAYPFKIRLKLQRSSKELVSKVKVPKHFDGLNFITLDSPYCETLLPKFFQIVMKPILKTTDELKRSETELKELLIKKDEEIKRYKKENIQVLQYLKTPAFDEERHQQQYKQYRDTFGTASIPMALLTKEIDVPELRTESSVKEEVICTSDIAVKNEVIKTELHGSVPEVKLEPESQNETITNSTANCIKDEFKTEDESVKLEPVNSIPMISPRKKKKIWNI